MSASEETSSAESEWCSAGVKGGDAFTHAPHSCNRFPEVIPIERFLIGGDLMHWGYEDGCAVGIIFNCRAIQVLSRAHSEHREHHDFSEFSAAMERNDQERRDPS